MKILYKDLLKFLKQEPSASEISESLYQLGHEHILSNEIFDMEFTPNRGDCLSVMGLARDLNIFFGYKDSLEIYEGKIERFNFDFENFSKEACPKISFLNIVIDEAPLKYKDYLDSYFINTGQKKNNFFADISNYLSYEMGQPSHCFDSTKITSNVTFEKKVCDEKFNTLLGTEINLTEENCVFSMNGKIISLGGILGGADTACSNTTKSAIVEFASFRPENILGKTVKYNINSEAAYKFERGVDIALQEKALRRFIQIVRDHSNVVSIEAQYNEYTLENKRELRLDVDKVNKILGTSISKDEFVEFLISLGFDVNKNIEIPSFRNDIETDNDIAEEIARLIGYNKIQSKELQIRNKIKKEKKLDIDDIKEKFTEFGFSEVINLPFVTFKTKDSVVIDNPLDKNKKFLRTSLKESLVNNLLYNERRQNDSIKLFEFSDIYSKDNQITKKTKLAFIASGRVSHDYLNFSKKIDKKFLDKILSQIFVEVPTIEEISRNNLDTKISDKIFYVEVDLHKSQIKLPKKQKEYSRIDKFNTYKSVSEYPSSSRDFSFSISKSHVVNEIISYFDGLSQENLKKVFLFDFYKNEKTNEVKLGYRLVFQSFTKTLSDNEIREHVLKILKPVLRKEGVEIPGFESLL